MKLVDSHAHLDYLEREGCDMEVIFANAREAGLSWMINPGVESSRFSDVISLAERYHTLFAAVAVHPSEVQHAGDIAACREEAERMLEHPKVIAIGETGLDYYWDKTHGERQQQFFRMFLELGRERNLPVIVHNREASEDVHRLVSEFPGVRGVMHCFSGDAPFAEAMINRGFYIGFAGNVTFKNAKTLQQVVRDLPLEKMLIETDSPFLSPAPFRGKPNEPARVKWVAEKIAALKNLSPETVAEVTSVNAQELFQPCLS